MEESVGTIIRFSSTVNKMINSPAQNFSGKSTYTSFYQITKSRSSHRTSRKAQRSFNAFHAAGECRRQVKDLTNVVNFFKIVEFHDHVWNHHEKYIEISTNMPVIGSLIREINLKCEKANAILLSKINARVVSVKHCQKTGNADKKDSLT